MCVCLRACVCVLKKGEMTFAYSCCFVSIWLTGLAGLVFLLPVIGWFSIQTAFEGVNPFLVTTLIVVCVLAVFGAWTRFWPTLKHRIRAGVLFEGLFSDAFPTTEEELVELSMKAYKGGRGGGLGVTTVSHGWSFFLQKKSAPGPRIWTTRFKGVVDEDEFIPRVWKAGTALADVKKNFKNVGRTMLDSPSMEWLSLGSWICSVSHGHPGALSSSPSPLHWVKRARVLDCETRQITDDDEATLYSKFHSSTSKKTRYVILTVEIKAESIVEDSIVQRFATRIETPDRLNEWRRGNHVRLMFVSRHRRCLGIVWTSPMNGKVKVTPRYHMHPHVCSRLAFWNHADINAAIPCFCNYAEGLRAYDGYAKLSDALSGVNPTFWPAQTILPHIFTVYNNELFVPLPSSTLSDANWLFNLIIRIQDFHYNYGGRTELRVSGDDTVLYLDLSVRSVNSIGLYHKMLFEYGIQKASQHPGKFVKENILPIREVPVSAVYRPLGLESA